MAPAGLPAEVEVFHATPGMDPASALRTCARVHPGRDILLLDRDAGLPPNAWSRLCAALELPFDVISPLSDALEAFDPFVGNARPGKTADADACVFMLSGHEPCAVDQWLPSCALWKAAALAGLDDDAPLIDGELPFGLQAALIDWLFVTNPTRLAPIRIADRREALAAVAALRLRIATLEGRIPTAAGRDDRPVLLHILHGWGGGVQGFVENLMQSSHGYHHLALVAGGSSQRHQPGEFLALHDALGAAPLRSWPLSRAIGATLLDSEEYRLALEWIRNHHRVSRILVSSLIGHSLDSLRTGLPTAMVCHDYYPFWPRLHEDFGNPKLDFSPARMEAALRDPGPEPLFSEPRPQAWRELREAHVQALLRAGATLFCPSQSVRHNLLRIEPRLATLDWRVIPHALAPWPEPVSTTLPPARTGLRVLVLGRINGGKGEVLLSALLEQLDPRIELVLLGAGRRGMRFFGRANVHLRLDYQREDLPLLIRQLAPDLALIPVTVAETFSYTLSELWSLGVPVLATRIGSLAERIHDGVDGLLVDANADAVATRLDALLEDRKALVKLRQPRPQAPLAVMAAAYEAALPPPVIPGWARPESGQLLQSSVLHALEIQANALRRKLDRLSHQARQQAAELERRGAWGDQLQSELDERTAWAESLQADIIIARKHIERLAEEVRERTLWASSLESDLGIARRHVEQLAKERDGRTAWAKSLEDDLTRARSHVETLTSELEQRTTWARSLENDLNEARKHVERLTDELDERTAWALSLQEDKHKMQQDLALWWQKYEESQSSLNQTRTELSQALDTLLERNREVDGLRKETEQLRDWLHSAVRHGEEMQRDRDTILASRSWRLTRPLRHAVRLLGSMRARMRFRWQRLGSLLRRTRTSLHNRGVNGTAARIREELRSTRTTRSAPLPIPANAPDISDIDLPTSDAPVASIVIPIYNHLDATLVCLRSLAQTRNRTAHEVIVVDDCSSDDSQALLPHIDGLHYQRNAENLGFIGACNAGAANARGEFVVFLNNDTAVQDGWLDALLDTFEQHQEVGLVGAKLVYPDGRLQEAGGIVFSDGSGWNYGRFDDPADPRYNFVREVDYCSGAAIALRTELFRHFGGFDAHYAPAYYEDTDLAMKVRQAGLRVLYQPASVVVHFEGVSSGTDTSSGTKRYQVINKEKFLERWKDALTSHPSPTLATHAGVALARQHRAKKRVLVIDATTPQPDHDSGSVRLVNILRLLLEEGCAVTFFADNRAFVEGYTQALQQIGVEVLWHPFLSDPVSWFEENGKHLDLVFVSRHYIASNYVDLVRRHARKARLAFDTVDLHYLREQRAAELAGNAELARTAEKTREQELALINASDVTLVVSPVEQQLLAREAPGARVDILSNVHEILGRRRDFAARSGIWFVGGYQHPPNIDAAVWFVRDILPRIREELPDLDFHLVGSKAPAEVKALGEQAGVQFHGFVHDIEPFLDGCRLAVAPLRYGAGVKGKVNMSMSYGQPVVATPIAIEGMFAEAGRDVLVAQNPADFAAQVIRAYQDEALWLQLSDHGLANVGRHFSFEAARTAIRQLLDAAPARPGSGG